MAYYRGKLLNTSTFQTATRKDLEAERPDVGDQKAIDPELFQMHRASVTHSESFKHRSSTRHLRDEAPGVFQVTRKRLQRGHYQWHCMPGPCQAERLEISDGPAFGELNDRDGYSIL